MPEPAWLNDLLEPKLADNSARFLVYSPVVTPRLHYCCRFIFNRVLGVHYRITADDRHFAESTEFRINYSYREMPEIFRVKPHVLITGEAMLDRHPEPFFRDRQIFFFPNQEKMAGLDFDIFSAVFYFISRHEEWQDFAPDRHQRFEAAQSLLFTKQYHLRPVVDQWILDFGLALRKLYPGLKLPVKKFRAISTIDVDNLFAYRHKGLLRNAGGAVKDLLRLKPGLVLERLLVCARLRRDPFDVYDELSSFAAGANLPLAFFFLMRHNTRYDRTINPAGGAFQPLVQRLKRRHPVGLHPSYGAAYNSTLLENEIELLEKAGNMKVLYSRQHFLRFDIRRTPPMLLQHGIRADFTMGFAGAPGFRAGTSHPFHYYDFKQERETQLLMVPFCFMDGAYSVYSRKDPREALVELLAMAAEVKATGGNFISVFHERSFSNRLYKGFGSLYKNLHLRLAQLEKQ